MRHIERAFPWLLLAPVLLPLVIWSGVIYPYLVPKTLLFYAFSLIAAAAFGILAAHGRAFYYARLTHKETWIPAALLALAYAASAASFDFYHSFWSLFIRGDGLLMLTCATASFYLILLSADRKFFDRLVLAAALVGSFVAVYGIGEWVIAGGRIGSLLGNAAFFAGYLGITFFATLASLRVLSRNWRRAALAGAGLQVVAIALTATRGTIAALAVAAVLYLAYSAFTTKGKTRTWAAGTLVALIAFSGLFFALRSELAKIPFAPIARIASISPVDPDVASRLFIWKNMVGEIKKAPWLGVGAENINVLFNRFYDPTQISEQWFDRSHNAFLDYAAQYGIGGLLLYLALIASFFIPARRFMGRGEKGLAVAVGFLAVTYAVQNFFVFDTISSFWLILALLAASGAASLEGARSALSLPSWSRFVSWPVAAVLVLLIIPVSILPGMAAYDLMHAYLYQITDVAKETSYLANGLSLKTYADVEYGYTVYDMYANQQEGALGGQARIDAYTAAVDILTSNFNRYPYDARTSLYLAHMLSITPPGLNPNQNLMLSAIQRTINLSPKRSQPWFLAVNLSLDMTNAYPADSMGRSQGYAATRALLMHYINIVPTLSQPYYVLAQIDLIIGDTATAANDAAKGKFYYKKDLDTARRAAGYYEGTSDWPDAVFFLNEIVTLNPSDHTSLYDLAKAVYLTGDRARADSIVAELRTIDPSIIGTDQNFLAAITAYEQSQK